MSKSINEWIASGSVSEEIAMQRGYVELVRCKDCKHRGEWKRAEDRHGSYSRIVFPDGSNCPAQCEDQFYSWLPDDDWFCANGERRDDDA